MGRGPVGRGWGTAKRLCLHSHSPTTPRAPLPLITALKDKQRAPYPSPGAHPRLRSLMILRGWAWKLPGRQAAFQGPQLPRGSREAAPPGLGVGCPGHASPAAEGWRPADKGGELGLSHCYYLNTFPLQNDSLGKYVKYQLRLNASKNSDHPSLLKQRNATPSWRTEAQPRQEPRPAASGAHGVGRASLAPPGSLWGSESHLHQGRLRSRPGPSV